MQTIRPGEILALTTENLKNTVRFSYVYDVNGDTVFTYYIGETVGESLKISQRMASLGGTIVPGDDLKIRLKETIYQCSSVSRDSMPEEFIPRYNLLRSL